LSIKFEFSSYRRNKNFTYTKPKYSFSKTEHWNKTLVQVEVLWVVTPCSFEIGYQCFRSEVHGASNFQGEVTFNLPQHHTGSKSTKPQISYKTCVYKTSKRCVFELLSWEIFERDDTINYIKKLTVD